MGLDKAAVRVTTPDVGGGFGMKASAYPEYFAVAFAARETGRPVRWMSTRSEAMLADSDGRDHVTVAEAAFDADLKLTALAHRLRRGARRLQRRPTSSSSSPSWR